MELKEIEVQLISNQRYVFGGDGIFSYDATGDKILILFKDSASVTIPWINVGMVMIRHKEG